MTQLDDPPPVEKHFREAVASLLPGSPDGDLGSASDEDDSVRQLFTAQAGSRHLDLEARRLAKRGLGFYSIGSAGHESNAAVAAALRPSDPALLHYRSGGFYLRRAAQLPDQDPLRDVLLGLVAAADEPIAGGRHKVFGNAALSIIPQTSTISSHLPRAVGLAFALGRAAGLGVEGSWPADAVVVCSFGDASVNHSTATGAINAALHSSYQDVPVPLLLVCEDNDIGISVRTPREWVAAGYRERAGLRYFFADGADPAACLEVAARASAWVREHRRPAFLHLHTVRLMGHAGSDVESAYRARSEIVDDHARDPLLGTARLLVERREWTASQVLATYDAIGAEVAAIAEEVVRRPRLRTAEEVMAPIASHHPDEVAREASRAVAVSFPPPSRAAGVTLAQSVNRTLSDLLASDERLLVFGQDVARKGGVYGVTRGLRKRFGGTRVFDTLLDEQSILGTALGLGLHGMLPVPEVQYLAYLHNAADQLRGEAATLGFFSNGAYRNPMVLRVAAYGYQQGFGGHFHNDDSVAALRDIPGLVVASPSRPDDAAAMLRTCVAAARVDGRVCVFLEPIALYHRRDLHEPGDEAWLTPYPDPGAGHVAIGSARLHGHGSDLTMVTFGNGLPMSLRAARTLAGQGIGTRVLDLRWLTPLPFADLLAAAAATGRVLVVDETRRSGGVSESVVTALVDGGFGGTVARVTSRDSFVPLGQAAELVLLDEQTVVDAARDLLRR